MKPFQNTNLGLGQSSCVGIGGDPVRGMNSSTLLALFERDPKTAGIVMVGEIGGCDEEAAAEYIRRHVSSRWSPYIAGVTAPRASAWAMRARSCGRQGTAADKYAALEKKRAYAPSGRRTSSAVR